MANTKVPVELVNLDGGVIINESSADVDFRVESNGNTHMIFVDGGSDHVNIGTATDLGGVLNVHSDDNNDTLVAYSSDADSNEGPVVRLWRNSASPADGDNLGFLYYTGENSADEKINYVELLGATEDVTNATEDGVFNIQTMVAGTSRSRMLVDSTGIVLNDASQDLDFRVESDNLTHALFVNGADGKVGINNSDPTGYYSDNLVLGCDDEGGMTLVASSTGHKNYIMFADGTSGSAAYRGAIGYDHNLDALSLGTAGGTARWVMDSTGAVTMPSQPAFQAKPSSEQTNIAINTAVTIVLDTEVFDQNADFASNTFTAPVTGKYQLNVTLRLQNVDSAAGYYHIYLKTSNRDYFSLLDPDYGQDAAFMTMHLSVLADMDASDTAYVQLYQSAGTAQTDIHSGDTVFSGYLVC